MTCWRGGSDPAPPVRVRNCSPDGQMVARPLPSTESTLRADTLPGRCKCWSYAAIESPSSMPSSTPKRLNGSVSPPTSEPGEPIVRGRLPTRAGCRLISVSGCQGPVPVFRFGSGTCVPVPEGVSGGVDAGGSTAGVGEGAVLAGAVVTDRVHLRMGIARSPGVFLRCRASRVVGRRSPSLGGCRRTRLQRGSRPDWECPAGCARSRRYRRSVRSGTPRS